jgi:hypothetical protein
MFKTVLAFLTGAGKGYVGSALRTGLSALGGILIAKGYVDAETVASLSEHIVGFVFILLAFAGSKLNNEQK